MNQVLSSKGQSLFYYIVLFGAAISAFTPLYLSMSTASSVATLLVSSLLMIFSFSRTNKGVEFFAFAREAYRELRKVTWPKKSETQQSVVAVAICVTVAALFFWMTDSIVMKILEWIISFASL